nr:PREDICTED: probable 4-coumarate--CoA ligase 3 isoform X2 [Bemisia tabaci]
MAINRGIVSSDGVVRSSSPDVEIPDQDFPTFIWSRAIEYADRPALTCGLTKRNYTFSEARSLSRRFGASLLDKGLNPGDVLAIMLPNAIDYPIVLLGALEAGLLVTTIDPAFKKNELSLQVRTTDAKVIVTIPTVVPLVKAVLEELGVTMPIILVNLRGQETGHDIWSYRDLISRSDGSDTQRQWPQISPDDIAILLSSSGTTGNDQHSLLMAASLSHLSGQLLVWSGLINGANNFILPVCEPEPLINALTEQKPLSVTCFLYPVMFSELNALVKTDDLEPLRLILTGCSSFIPAHVNAFLAKLPNREKASFYSVFGLTEVLPLFMALQNDQNPLNLGYPEPNTELKVIDARGKSLGPGEVGELCVRGPQVMKGYFNNEKATQDTFDGDWFKTGDTVYYDEDGMFHLAGRSKDLIKVGGRSVSPSELEFVLLSHPKIADAGVVGVPDDTVGEKPVAFVVPKPGVEIDPREIQAFVSSELAPHKALSRVIVTDALPRNSIGKMLKRVLKELLCSKGL